MANLRPRTANAGLGVRSPPFSLPPQLPPSLLTPYWWRRGCGRDLALVSEEGGEAGPEPWGGAGGQGPEHEGRGLEPKGGPELWVGAGRLEEIEPVYGAGFAESGWGHL